MDRKQQHRDFRFVEFQGYHVAPPREVGYAQKGLNPLRLGAALAVIIKFIRAEAAVWGL